MSLGFPFDLPGPTALYVCLYLVTLALHVAFMSYVLAGSGYVAVAAVIAWSRGQASSEPVARVLRDWLPFGLGAAITAGVAPLLFLQILYKENFYTANLLLFHRWMAVVPVLIVGFYLLYLAKSEAVERWGRRAGATVAVAAFACFVFTAYSWTEMHLLALDPGAWPEFYAQGRMTYSSASLVPRVAMWLAGSAPIMAVIVGWQLWQKDEGSGAHIKLLAAIALAGILAAAGFAAWYRHTLDELASAALRAPAARVYLAVVAAGLVAQALAWAYALATARLPYRALIVTTMGAAAAILGTACAREILRMGMLAMDELLAVHARALESGGMAMFLAFLVINIGVIAWCFAIARRGLKQGEAGPGRDSTPR
jgi:hypothetical protein